MSCSPHYTITKGGNTLVPSIELQGTQGWPHQNCAVLLSMVVLKVTTLFLVSVTDCVKAIG